MSINLNYFRKKKITKIIKFKLPKNLNIKIFIGTIHFGSNSIYLERIRSHILNPNKSDSLLFRETPS